MAEVIGSIAAVWDPGAGYTCPPGADFEARLAQDRLMRIYADTGEPVELRVEIKRRRAGRSIRQNRLMWALLEVMAEHGLGDNPEACYVDMLAAAGAQSHFLEVPVASLHLLRNAYRVVKVVEVLPDNRCVCQAVIGSSAFDKQEMHAFIERLFDRIAEAGIDDPRVTGLWRDWEGL